MYIKQISVFVENKQGRLAEITEEIAKNGIDIRALSLADTTNFGILRLIVDKPYEAEKILKAAGCTVSLTAVIAIAIDDRPGALAEALRVMADGGISVEYLYAFITRKKEDAYVIFRMEDNKRASDILVSHGIKLATPEEIYKL